MTLSSSVQQSLKRHFKQQKYVLFKSGRNHLKQVLQLLLV